MSVMQGGEKLAAQLAPAVERKPAAKAKPAAAVKPAVKSESAAKSSPLRQAQLAESKEAALAEEVLTLSRNELYVSMHFLDRALSALRLWPRPGLCGEGNGRPIGTDGQSLFFDAEGLLALFPQGRSLVNRAFLHSVLHCIFFHFAGQKGRDSALYDLSCDIAVEHLIDGMRIPALHAPQPALKRACYQMLQAAGIPAFNAESIYAQLKKQPPEDSAALLAVFAVDNHSAWPRPETDDEQPNSPAMAAFLKLQQDWQDVREALQTAIETGGEEAGNEEGGLSEALKIENRRRYDFRSFLRRFSVLREELQADEDSFDYIAYTYGLSHYGNMPLIEPLETRERFAVAEFVIAIDTSYSTSGALVRRFLEEAYQALTAQNTYFRKVRIRIIQCDDRIQSDQLIENREALLRYMNQFQLLGNGGTDFRPVFAYVDGLIRQQQFQHLKGLIYFTDGRGIYPAKRPPYDVAFVFLDDSYDDTDVPPWAMKLFIRTEELERKA